MANAIPSPTWQSCHCQLILAPCFSPPCLTTISISSVFEALSSNALIDALTSSRPWAYKQHERVLPVLGQETIRKRKARVKSRILHRCLPCLSLGTYGSGNIIHLTLFLVNNFKYFKDLQVSSGKNAHIYTHTYSRKTHLPRNTL